jgi:replicative DNA helicase
VNLEIAALKALAGEAAVNPARAIELVNLTGCCIEDFESQPLRQLWAAMLAVVRAGNTIDTVAMVHKLRGTVDVKLVADVLTDTHLGVTEQRLRILHEVGIKRRWLSMNEQVAELIRDKNRTPEEIATHAQRMVLSWAAEGTEQSMTESSHQLLAEIDANSNGSRTVSTGIETLDAVIGGLQPTLTILGALPGIGKSALIAAICRNIAKTGRRVGLISLEDEKTWLTRRLVAEATGIPVFVLANRKLTSKQREAVEEAISQIHLLHENIYVNDLPNRSPSQVVQIAQRQISQGCSAILVDHLGEVALDRNDRHDLEIADALRQLRTVAKIHQVPVVVAAHLRRREGLGAWTEPLLTDFAFSSAVERMARVAIALWRIKDVDDRMNCTVLKQTQGAAGVTIELNLNRMAGMVVDTQASEAAKNLYTLDMFREH